MESNIKCPNCKSELEIEPSEKEAGLLRCPVCDSLIDISKEIPEIVPDKEYIELVSYMNQGDLSLIKSMLENGEIDYFITGENFLGVDPLIQPAKILVLKEQYEDASEILKDFKSHIFGVSPKDIDEEEQDSE